MKQRIYGIDLLKVMACIGVVSLHTVNGSLGMVNRIVTLVCSLSIPIFFMCSGYVAFLKENISYKYVAKKIIKILAVCFSWEMIHAIVYFLYYHEMRNFIESFFMDFLQKGLFFHFWFFGALIILYLLLPILRKMEQKTPRVYIGLLAFLGGVCICIDEISIAAGQQMSLSVIQTFRLWQWLFYYMLGGFIVTHSGKISVWFCKYRDMYVVMALFVLVAWQWIVGTHCFGGIMVEGFYGSLPVIMATLCAFLYLYQAKLNDAMIPVIKMATSCIMGVYIVHPFILAAMVHFIPAFGTNGILNLIYCMITVFVSSIIVWMIGRIPVVSELIKI